MDGNGITINKGQVSFWATVLVGLMSVIGTYFGASRPAQAPQSAENQSQILNNQAFVMSQVAKIDEMSNTQKKILDRLTEMDKVKVK